MDDYMLLHRPVVCRSACAEYSTCVYYQLHDDRCYLCIRNTVEFADAELIEVTADIAAEAFVKIGIEDIIFTSSGCIGDINPNPRPEGNNVHFNEYHVTAIHFCGSSFGSFIGLVAGFTLYINGDQQSRKGCIPLVNPDPFEIIEFDDDEKVLHFEFYMGLNTYYVLQAITVHTTHAVYGPFGITSGSDLYEARGYDFQGFSGWVNYAIDYIGANFERC